MAQKNNAEAIKQTEHILVCLSASPSNANIILTAKKMATAFQGNFTALYVQTPASSKMNEEDKNRLKSNMKLAEQLGADISTVYGEDISFQISEYARISKVTKIVMGRSNIKRSHIWSKPSLSERLIEAVPNLEIHIIPDGALATRYIEKKKDFLHSLIPTVKDIAIMALIMALATIIGTCFQILGFTEANIITVYILAVLLVSLFAKSYICSVVSSLAGVLLFNFFFTKPRLTFHAYEQGYPFTFMIMLAASLITGTLAGKLKNHARQSAQAAFRTQVLFDTNQLLHKVSDENDIIRTVASQLTKLLNRDVVIYIENNGKISKGQMFSASGANVSTLSAFKEFEIVEWVFHNRKRAGAGTNTFRDAKNMYLAIRINQSVYGVVGIAINNVPLDSFENSIILSIVGECALAIENSRNAKAKEDANILAQKEQLRANLLRAISHDLRTPLTSISGNASNLISNSIMLDDDTRIQMYHDIYNDSQWLISLVENLLSITRLEDGRLQFNITVELISDVIEEALKHLNPRSVEHTIKVVNSEELLLAKMDVKLILQVIINIVDNAIKYTQDGSVIEIRTEKKNQKIVVSISDNGEGIPDEMKSKVFEMFFTGANDIVDSRRSLGLGLPLCKSIVNAHGGELILTDNTPHGCIFSFTLPLEEEFEIE